MPSADPIDIYEASETSLGLAWQDGHKSVYPFEHLRKMCPCANCGDLRKKYGPLIIDGTKLRVKEIRPVGRYALCFDWSDGHSTGIYSFEFLREICPCEDCSKAKSEV